MPQVVRAALFDLLTMQCDRHAQNVFIDEQVGEGGLAVSSEGLQRGCGIAVETAHATSSQVKEYGGAGVVKTARGCKGIARSTGGGVLSNPSQRVHLLPLNLLAGACCVLPA